MMKVRWMKNSSASIAAFQYCVINVFIILLVMALV